MHEQNRDDEAAPLAKTAATGRDARADAIIRAHMNYSMVGGAIPIPLIDLAALTAVQLDLLKELAHLYGISFDSRSAPGFLTSLGSAMAGRMVARLGAASVSKVIPGLGSLAGAMAGVTLNGAFTFAVGTVVKRHFADGKPLEELDVRRVRDELGHLVEAGKREATVLRERLKRGSEEDDR